MSVTQEKLRIKNWALADRPREKLLAKGKRHLTNAELIAIMILSGNNSETAVDLSKRILQNYENDLVNLSRVTVNELCRFKGIGKAKAIAIVAALELGRRRKEAVNERQKKITSSKDVYDLLLPEFAYLTHEEFWILILSRSNFVTGRQLISKGGQSGTVVDPKMVFKVALEQNAAAIIVAHNHPSGNLIASASDISITKKLVKSGLLLEIPVLDHVIITDEGYFSLADADLMGN